MTISRRAYLLGALALVGVASLLLVPWEAMSPQLAALPAPRVIAIVQPVVLALAAVALGCWLAPKAGLGTPLLDAIADGIGAGAVLRRQAAAAVPVGLAVAALLIAYGATIGAGLIAGSVPGRLDMPLATKLLYGGIAEEVMTRWGLMSLFVRAGMRLGLRGPAPYGIGIALAAMLFAFGHIPLLMLVRPDAPAWMIATVLAANALPGAAFGWLFWRRGLEAAMLAHALAHLVATSAGIG